MIETDVTVERAVAAIRAATRPPLGELRAIAAALQAHIAAALTSPQRAAFDFTPELLLPFLERQSPLIDGAGIAYSPGAFADQPTWVDWWHFDDERPTHIPYDLNPRSIGYYDYASREWFQAPRDLGRPVAIGPYVDSGGIFLNTVRLALPVPTASGTHTLGCDLSLTRLESLFVHAVAAVDPPLALVGGSGRVLASNSARHTAGTRASAAWRTWPVFTDGDGLATVWTVRAPADEPSAPPCGADQAGRRANRRNDSRVIAGVSGVADSAT